MEAIRGNHDQIASARSYLNLLREVLPFDEFSKKTVNTRFDIWLQQGYKNVFNPSLFYEIIDSTSSKIKAYDSKFQTLPYDRYVIGEVNTQLDKDTGGFNSRYARGFKYFANCGFAVVLSERYTTNSEAVTLELARSYLHDCIHSASFRTIRVLPEGSKSKFPVYREQYGINFRRANGTSYSALYSHEESPQRINLGVLMDGITVMMTAEHLTPYTTQLKSAELNDFERMIVSDIELDLDSLPDAYRGKGFHNNVTVPSQLFIEQRGGYELYKHLVRAMLTGRMKDVVKYLGGGKFWKQLFKSESY